MLKIIFKGICLLCDLNLDEGICLEFFGDVGLSTYVSFMDQTGLILD